MGRYHIDQNWQVVFCDGSSSCVLRGLLGFTPPHFDSLDDVSAFFANQSGAFFGFDGTNAFPPAPPVGLDNSNAAVEVPVVSVAPPTLAAPATTVPTPSAPPVPRTPADKKGHISLSDLNSKGKKGADFAGGDGKVSVSDLDSEHKTFSARIKEAPREPADSEIIKIGDRLYSPLGRYDSPTRGHIEATGSFTKFDDEWVVRVYGEPCGVGDLVPVSKKDGAVSYHVILETISIEDRLYHAVKYPETTSVCRGTNGRYYLVGEGLQRGMILDVVNGRDGSVSRKTVEHVLGDDKVGRVAVYRNGECVFGFYNPGRVVKGDIVVMNDGRDAVVVDVRQSKSGDDYCVFRVLEEGENS